MVTCKTVAGVLHVHLVCGATQELKLNQLLQASAPMATSAPETSPRRTTRQGVECCIPRRVCLSSPCPPGSLCCISFAIAVGAGPTLVQLMVAHDSETTIAFQAPARSLA